MSGGQFLKLIKVCFVSSYQSAKKIFLQVPCTVFRHLFAKISLQVYWKGSSIFLRNKFSDCIRRLSFFQYGSQDPLSWLCGS